MTASSGLEFDGLERVGFELIWSHNRFEIAATHQGAITTESEVEVNRNYQVESIGYIGLLLTVIVTVARFVTSASRIFAPTQGFGANCAIHANFDEYR
jgi:hypothetical protein